jgi:UDP-glucose 4-epimerase
MSTIAVTGGAGFVGSNLVRALLRENFRVIVIDDFSTGLRSNVENLDCEIREASLVNEREIQDALRGSEYIFHLAARGSVPRSIRNPRATHDVNTTGTLNVLEYARKNRTPISFSSSSSVYGTNGQLPKNEKMWTGPITPYAASKLSGEALVQSYAMSYGIPSVTYRFFNIFGPWQRPDHSYAAVIPKWIWKIMNNEKIEVYGDGEQSRDFTYVDDVIRILITGMKNKIDHPEPLNLAFGERITLNQVLQIMSERHGKIEINKLPERSGDVKNSQNDPSELKRVFPNVSPKDFRTALFEVWDWLEQNYSKVINGPIVSD